MRASSLTISGIFHVAVVAVTMLSMPWLKKDLEIPKPIMVEFVEIGKVTETTKVSSAPAKKTEEPKPKDAPPPPAPKNTSKAPTPPPPKKDTAKDEPKKDTRKEATAKTDPAAKPDKKKPEKKPEKEKAAEPERDFGSVLKNLADMKTPAVPAQKQPDMGLDEAAPQEGANAPLGQKMTMSEEDALRRQLERCWNVPFGAKDAQDLNVEIFMVINPDRTLREARVVDRARYNSDSFFRAAADSAMRAVQNPLCSPFDLPPDKYEVWQRTTVNFNPREMF